MDVGELRLRGAHNLENAMAAAAAALARGIDPDRVCDALRSFPGVPHRLEEVAERDGVRVRERLEGHERGRRRWSASRPSRGACT